MNERQTLDVDELDLNKLRQTLDEYGDYDVDNEEATYFDAQQIDSWFQERTTEKQDIQRQESELTTTNFPNSYWVKKLFEEANPSQEITFTKLQNLISDRVSDELLTLLIEHLERQGIKIVFPETYWDNETHITVDDANLSEEYIQDYDFYEYLRSISRYPLLSKNEELTLILLSQNGNIEARNRLAQSYLRYVVNLALHYKDKGLPLMDIIQEGNIGLLKAIERFDMKKGDRLYHYAHWWIRQSIIRSISEQKRLIRLPDYIDEKIKALREAKCEPCELAETLNMTEEEAKQLLLLAEGDYLTLEEFEKEQKRRLEYCELDGYLPIEEHMEKLMVHDILTKIMNDKLSKREQQIIILRYGLHNGEPETLKTIGRKFGLSRERIRQIENDAMEKLKQRAQMKLFNQQVFKKKTQRKSVSISSPKIREKRTRKYHTTSSDKVSDTSKEKYLEKSVSSKSRKVKLQSWEERQQKIVENAQLVFDWLKERVSDREKSNSDS